MKKRKVFVIIGLAVFLLSIVASAWLFLREEEETMGIEQLPLVEVRKVKNKDVLTWVDFTGRLTAKEQVELFSEVSGVFKSTAKPFKVGVYYKKGEPIIGIEAGEAAENVLSQKGNFVSTLTQVIPDLKIDYPDIYPRWRDYLRNFNYNRPLQPLPSVNTEQQKLFLTGRNVYAQYHGLKQLEERLDKYTIRAPFDGVVTEANIKEGTLVQPGMNLGQFEKTDVYELEAAISQYESRYVAIGDSVYVNPVGDDGTTYRGIVTRINERIDPETQSIKLIVQVCGKNLKSGMYMKGRTRGEIFNHAIQIPLDILVDEEKVLIVRDSIAMFQQVSKLEASGDSVVIEGLADGTLLVEEERSPAFAGTKVKPVTISN